MSNLAEQPANVDIGSAPNLVMSIVQSVFIPMPVSNARAAGASFAVLKKGKAKVCPLEYENLCDGVDLTIPIKVVEEGRNSFARCLIEVRADTALKDNVTMAIPLPDGEGFTKETFQIFGHVYDQCPKNVTCIPTVDKMNNDGFQMVVNKRKSGKIGSTINNRSGAAVGKAAWQPIKQNVNYEPKAHGNLPKNGAPKVSSSAKYVPSKNMPATKGGLHVPTSKPIVPTSNPYDVLNDMESNEEAEVVYDETVILNDTRTGASPSMALDGVYQALCLRLCGTSVTFHLCIPELKRNSLGTLEKEGYTIKLQSGKVKVINGSRVVLSGTRRDNCVWHKRLGHITEAGKAGAVWQEESRYVSWKNTRRYEA
ncbi:hypothetical protein Tco_1086028 [Tanacetum coccineum]